MSECSSSSQKNIIDIYNGNEFFFVEERIFITITFYTNMTICFRLRDLGACKYGKLCYNNVHIKPHRICNEWKRTGWCSNFRKCQASHPPSQKAASPSQQGEALPILEEPAVPVQHEPALTVQQELASPVKHEVASPIQAEATPSQDESQDVDMHAVSPEKWTADVQSLNDWPSCSSQLIFGTVEKSILGQSLCFNNMIQ